MDAAGDQDIKLQRSSPDRIAELRRSLPRFLWKSKATEEGAPPVTRVRTLVLKSKTEGLINLVGPSHGICELPPRLMHTFYSSWSRSRNGRNYWIPIW